MTDGVQAAIERWKGFPTGEMRVILRGLSLLDRTWSDDASASTVRSARNMRNRRDRLKAEIQAELERRRQ